jgi:hypothetical protein
MAPQQIERRIDPEPAGREIERDPEQRLELVEPLLRLTEQGLSSLRQAGFGGRSGELTGECVL